MLFVLLGTIVLSACEGETKVETVVEKETVIIEQTVVEKETVVEEGQTVVMEKTVVEEKTVVVTATPEPVVAEPKTLVVCQGQEPDTLYIYGGAMLAARSIQHAIYDGPIDNRTFGYQPIIFDKLPALADGDAVINTVTVAEGDMVVNALGDPEELTVGESVIREAGCYSTECEVTYEGGEVEMEQMEVTFMLKEGIMWSDGEPLKASDSVYAFSLYMDPDTPTPSRYVGERTASYEALDDMTTVWTGLPGYRDSTYFTNFFGPLPEHQLGGMTAAEIVESEEASRTPLGWGAFVITEWVAGDHITAIKNENYFRADEGLPYVDEVIYRFIAPNANSAIAAVLSGSATS
jgi:peptide/nickel transport system substrate-binding protein